MRAYVIATGSTREPQFLKEVRVDGKVITSEHECEGVHFQTLNDARAVLELVQPMRQQPERWRVCQVRDRCNRLS